MVPSEIVCNAPEANERYFFIGNATPSVWILPKSRCG